MAALLWMFVPVDDKGRLLGNCSFPVTLKTDCIAIPVYDYLHPTVPSEPTCMGY